MIMYSYSIYIIYNVDVDHAKAVSDRRYLMYSILYIYNVREREVNHVKRHCMIDHAHSDKDNAGISPCH